MHQKLILQITPQSSFIKSENISLPIAAKTIYWMTLTIFHAINFWRIWYGPFNFCELITLSVLPFNSIIRVSVTQNNMYHTISLIRNYIIDKKTFAVNHTNSGRWTFSFELNITSKIQQSCVPKSSFVRISDCIILYIEKVPIYV